MASAAEAIAQADLDRDALCGAEFVIGHGATPYRNGRVLHSVFAAAEHLPQLMADAIVGSLSIEQLQASTGPTCEINKEPRIRERFHSAFSSALIRKIRTP